MADYFASISPASGPIVYMIATVFLFCLVFLDLCFGDFVYCACQKEEARHSNTYVIGMIFPVSS